MKNPENSLRQKVEVEQKKIEQKKLREQWNSLFSKEETKNLVGRQVARDRTYPEGKDVVALFRVSCMGKEETPQWRSWTEDFYNVIFYLEHRFLNDLKEQQKNRKFIFYDPNSEGSRLAYWPVIKIIKRSDVSAENIRPGLENNELEINEEKLSPERTIFISSPTEVEELRNIFLEQFNPNTEIYQKVKEVIDIFERIMKEIEQIKQNIENGES